MSNHIHCILSSHNGTLSNIIRDFISVTQVSRLLKVYKIRMKAAENGCCINSNILLLNTSETKYTKFGHMKIIRLNWKATCLNNA